MDPEGCAINHVQRTAMANFAHLYVNVRRMKGEELVLSILVLNNLLRINSRGSYLY